MTAWVTTAIEQSWGAGFDLVFLSPAHGDLAAGDQFTATARIGAQVFVGVRYERTYADGGIWYNEFGYVAAAAYVGLPWDDGDYRTIRYPADGSMQTLSASLAMGAVLKTRWGSAPLDDKANVTHSKEALAEDGWFPTENQLGTATLGAASQTDTLTTPIEPTDARLDLNLIVEYHYVTGDLVRFEGINFNGAPIDAVGLTDRALTPTATGSSWTGEVLRAVGAGQTIRYYFEAVTESATFIEDEWIKAPRVYTFTGLDVSSMGSAAP